MAGKRSFPAPALVVQQRHYHQPVSRSAADAARTPRFMVAPQQVDACTVVNLPQPVVRRRASCQPTPAKVSPPRVRRPAYIARSITCRQRHLTCIANASAPAFDKRSEDEDDEDEEGRKH